MHLETTGKVPFQSTVKTVAEEVQRILLAGVCHTMVILLPADETFEKGRKKH